MEKFVLILLGIIIGVVLAVTFIRASGDRTDKSQAAIVKKLSEADDKASAAASEATKKMFDNR